MNNISNFHKQFMESAVKDADNTRLFLHSTVDSTIAVILFTAEAILRGVGPRPKCVFNRVESRVSTYKNISPLILTTWAASKRIPDNAKFIIFGGHVDHGLSEWVNSIGGKDRLMLITNEPTDFERTLDWVCFDDTSPSLAAMVSTLIGADTDNANKMVKAANDHNCGWDTIYTEALADKLELLIDRSYVTLITDTIYEFSGRVAGGPPILTIGDNTPILSISDYLLREIDKCKNFTKATVARMADATFEVGFSEITGELAGKTAVILGSLGSSRATCMKRYLLEHPNYDNIVVWDPSKNDEISIRTVNLNTDLGNILRKYVADGICRHNKRRQTITLPFNITNLVLSGTINNRDCGFGCVKA